MTIEVETKTMQSMIQKTPGSPNIDEKRAGASYTQNERHLLDEMHDNLSKIQAILKMGDLGPRVIDGGGA